jgi:hypothetical protein
MEIIEREQQETFLESLINICQVFRRHSLSHSSIYARYLGDMP